MWFASLFSNEALISISTVQLLHFSHSDFASASPSSGLPARKVCLEGEVRAAPEAHIPSFSKSSFTKSGQKYPGREHSQGTWRMHWLDAPSSSCLRYKSSQLSRKEITLHEAGTHTTKLIGLGSTHHPQCFHSSQMRKHSQSKPLSCSLVGDYWLI